MKDLRIEKINEIVKELEKEDISRGEISDGYHTFNELYYHRMLLFSIICNQNKEIAWKSKLHDDGTMFDDYFIVGITTPKGDFTYHYELKIGICLKLKSLKQLLNGTDTNRKI